LEKVLANEELVHGTGLRMIELFLDREDVPKGPLAMLMGKEQKRVQGLTPKREVVP
jgi:pyruvate decarboxylase